MYAYATFIILLIQFSNMASVYSFEVELFKQSIYYYTFKSYQYVKSQIKKWFPTPEPAKQVEKKQIERYEDKYTQKFYESEMKQLTPEELEKLKTNILLENTPVGNIIMFYNFEKEAFEYYSDKIIPYRFLNAAGRKYVVQFRCKCVFTEKITAKKNQKGIIKYIKESNKYVCLGKLSNFSFLQKVNKKNKLSFKEYKNMLY